MSKLKQRAFVYGLALFYGWLTILRILFEWCRRPSVKFWERKTRDEPPACLNDSALGQHSYVHLRDVKLHYVENGDRSKPLMLCVHGFPEFWYSWRHQLKEFSKDYWVVAIDMRGYGDSDKPTGLEPYGIDLLVDDLRELIVALGREQCVLVAHDWGGIIAWHFVEKCPEMVQRFIIMDAPYMRLYAKYVMSHFKQFLRAWYTFFFLLPFLPEFTLLRYDMNFIEEMLGKDKANKNSKITDQDIEAYKYTFGKPGALTPPINYYRSNLWRRSKKGKRTDLGENTPHGLLIFGQNDAYLDQELVRLSAEMVKNLQTFIVPDANHFVQQDQPEKY
ncbi:hypothetical protein B566_EDAN010144 [Ephemera danica]|nr:hypothetical protein B566_EDAN010144 [Ephemera danica]